MQLAEGSVFDHINLILYINIFLIRINSLVNLAMSVCPSVCKNVEISGAIKDRRLRFSIHTS